MSTNVINVLYFFFFNIATVQVRSSAPFINSLWKTTNRLGTSYVLEQQYRNNKMFNLLCSRSSGGSCHRNRQSQTSSLCFQSIPYHGPSSTNNQYIHTQRRLGHKYNFAPNYEINQSFIHSTSSPSSPIRALHNRHAKFAHITRRTKPLNMALLPIPVETLEQIITSRLPTSAQYTSYWGRTSREQYNAAFEAFGVSFLGVFASYFLSFAIGQFIATVLGMIAGTWILLGPELKAYQRNWELTSGRELVDQWIDEDDDLYELDEDKRGLYGAFYLGRIDHVCVVDYPTDLPEDENTLDEFEGYTMEKDENERETGIPYSLRLRVTDATDFDDGRELQIHTRMSEEYLDLQRGMPVCAVLLSTSQKFQSLAAITDFCIPDAGPCWVGDYPYLDRPALEQLLVEDEELWDSFREEGRYFYI